MPDKNKIIIFGALAITLLLNLPRFLIMLMRKDFVETFELTYAELVLRLIILFCFSWVVLSYNINWKSKFISHSSTLATLRDIFINALLLLIGVSSLTAFKQWFIADYIFDAQSYFFVAFFTYLIVLTILILLSWLVRLTIQSQQTFREKEQAKRKALHHQLEALRSQINPHFLFNTLNSLNALIHQKSEKASIFVDKLSVLLRATLEQSDKDHITIQEELAYIENYIFLQKERFGDKLNIEINIPDDWKRETIPSFSLQLLVENAIKHNVISNKQPLTIKIFKEGTFLIICNPIQKRSDNIESTGKGLQNLSTRFKLLKKQDIQIEKTDHLFSVKLPII